MGTKGSYTGGGGAAGNALRDEIVNWLDGPPGDLPGPSESDESGEGADSESPPHRPLIPEALLPVIGLLRPRPSGGGDGPGSMGGAASGGPGGGGSRSSTGGAQRSAARSASTAGRAAAAAYALRSGNAAELSELGLDYEALRANDDPIDVTRRIVDAACGPLSDGTIEDEERRIVAAQVAQWVLEENVGGAPPDPVEIVREAIALIIFEAATNETAAAVRNGNRPLAATRETERQIRDTADALAQRAELSPGGPTATEFEQAIEQGIETLRRIWTAE